MNGILQISAGWMENGRKLKSSQERLPLRVSPKGKSSRMKIAEKISSSSRRSAMISTSIRVNTTYKITPRINASVCVRTNCALPLTFVALEMTTMPKTLAETQQHHVRPPDKAADRLPDPMHTAASLREK